VRQQRYRRHKAGDHSLCSRSRCQDARPSLKIAEVPAGSGGGLDPQAALRDLAVQLAAAYAADPANASLAKELRSTLLVLAPRQDEDVKAELVKLMTELQG
jgi:hypothetical protein